MSDPVTNVEIEDVLSSIRRLVSDGDKARTHDPAPVEVPVDLRANVTNAVTNTAESESAKLPASDTKTDCLILTPAFLVVDADKDDADKDDVDDAPLALTKMIWDDFEETGNTQPVAPKIAASSVTTPDRTNLVATIAELEAAISAGDDDYEPEDSEMLSETIAWPGRATFGAESVEEAEVSSNKTEPAAKLEIDVADAPKEAVAAFEHRKIEDVALPESAAEISSEPADIYGDDDLDDLLEADETTLDDEALRKLVADVVREELTGPLGERITRNVRKLVRREIYRILSSQEFD